MTDVNSAPERRSSTLASRNSPKSLKKGIIFSVFSGVLVLSGLGVWGFTSRYHAKDTMLVPLKELSNTEYPANPAPLGDDFQRYSNRKLTIIKKDDTYFDFVLEPTDEKTAKIVIKNVDLSLMVPKAPQWVKQNAGLKTIAFVDREWNRQQVSFPAISEQIEISGGNGFEKENLVEIAIANNCLNAGYWEVLLFTKKGDSKFLYYQSWFTFPMGHYKNVFEKINAQSYWDDWWRLEHWQDPKGTVVKTDLLRTVINKKELSAQFPLDEKIIVSGEQGRKVRTTLATNLTTWRDFYSGKHDIKFATFRPPGFYDTNRPWGNEYWRIGEFQKATLRTIKSAGSEENLEEIEIAFKDTKTSEQNRLFISGIDLKNLPKLSTKDYSKGLYMPMGIGIPPFYQSYTDLEKNHPDLSPYFSVLLDSKDRWIDHHRLALDGITMHLDKENPDILHLYLLSYERNTLISHFIINLNKGSQPRIHTDERG